MGEKGGNAVKPRPKQHSKAQAENGNSFSESPESNQPSTSETQINNLGPLDSEIPPTDETVSKSNGQDKEVGERENHPVEKGGNAVKPRPKRHSKAQAENGNSFSE